MTNNPITLHSSQHNIDAANSNVIEIVRWVKMTASTSDWSKFRILAFVVSPTVMAHFIGIARPGETEFNPLRFSLPASDTLEKLLLSLYQDQLSQDKSSPWNKLLLGYDDEKNKPYYATQWDNDWEWLNTIDPENETYLELDSNAESSIMTWEGLPKGHPRPWAASREKDKAHTQASQFIVN